MVSRAPNYPTVSKGYDLTDGSFNRVRATAGQTKEFVTTNYNEEDHEAFNAASIHNNFQVFEDGKFYLYKRGDAEYSIDWPDVYPEYPLADGRLTLQKDTSYNSIKTV
jgi:hypothetical protein